MQWQNHALDLGSRNDPENGTADVRVAMHQTGDVEFLVDLLVSLSLVNSLKFVVWVWPPCVEEGN
jgi:hypothetical protein